MAKKFGYQRPGWNHLAIDVASKRVIQTLDTNVHGANRLKFTPNGKLVFVSTLAAPDLVIVDAATRKEAKRIKIGRGAAGILMQPDGSQAFVACTPDDYVAVIDLKTLEMTEKLRQESSQTASPGLVRK